MNRVEHIVVHQRRRAWLSTCAMATALAVAPQAAHAQAFQGTPTTVIGSDLVTTGPNTTTINLRTSETVINWTPTDVAGSGTIDFLPTGSTATFNGVGNFTVLNRILPVDTKGNPAARMVGFNGTVNSNDVSAGTTGGSVWFYTPTGFVIGPTATMNVGNLILTTDDIVYGAASTGGTELYGPGNTVMFRGAAGSAGLIDVRSGASLNAIGADSYIAMVAPRIQQGGTVSANRSVAYVAAEQADLSINAGLFDISILVGTTDPNGIVHTGTTTGSASTSGFDAKSISFVAMPKATALTMLLSGSIGYLPAADAFNDGSAVVLSAGYTTDQPVSEAPGSLGNISIDGAAFTNPTVAAASGTIGITGAAGPVSFGSSTNLFAQDGINITLGAGQQLNAASSLNLRSGRSGTGGKINIAVGNGASFAVTDYLTLDTSTFASFIAPASIDFTGGDVAVDVNGGTFSASGVYATAFGYAGYDPVQGGRGTGGSVAFTARNGGAITASSFEATAEGAGGNSDGTGGDGIGGSVSLTSINGALNFDSVYLGATGTSGAGGLVAGTASGGSIGVRLNGGTYNWTDLYFSADAAAGYSTAAGAQGNSAAANANAITLTLGNNASLNVTNDIYMLASGSATVNAPAGASGRGGGISVDIANGSSLAFRNLNAYAEGGLTLSYFDGITPTTTPDVVGGTINFNNAGQVSGNSISLIADAAQLGASSAAGTAHGGTIGLTVSNGGNLTLNDGSGTASLLLDAGGLGAVGTSAANALGGAATLTISDGTVDVGGSVTVSAGSGWHQGNAFYGSGPDPQKGFDAQGGSATVQLLTGTNGTGQLTATSLEVNAAGNATTPAFDYIGFEGGPPSGTYGGPMSANAGNGTGGTAALSVGAGTLNVADVTVNASGQGGISNTSFGTTPYQSGDGFGGTARIGVAGGTSTISNLSVNASGVGGGGSPASGVEVSSELAALAGNGTGGNALVTVSGGTLSPNSLQLNATGTGGAGADHVSGGAATDGGAGTGGTALLSSPAGATGQLTSPNVLILAGGFGGTGGTSSGGTNGNGGNGVGGSAGTNLADGAFTLGALALGADGVGGNGAVGGRGTGGNSNFKLVDSSGPSGSRTIGALSLYANGVGGTGTTGQGPSDAGSTGLDVEAFDNASGLAITGDLTVEAIGANAPVGEGFISLIGGAPLQVGGNTSITTTRDATIGTLTPLQTVGNVDISARRVAGNQLSAGGTVSIFGQQGIALEKLSSGATTSLQAPNGAITVGHLASVGDVSAVAQAVGTFSNGSISFANLQATAGDVQVVAQGNLTTAGATATGNVIMSSQGVLASSAPISGGGYISLTGTNGISAGTVMSGGTTDLSATGGNVSITDLHSPGSVTATGRSIDITSPAALLFNTANATAGHLNVSALSLTGTGPLSATGNVSLIGTNGISLASLTSGDTTGLRANGGDILVADLRSAGLVTARARSIVINSGAGLTFDTATATAGDLTLGTALGLTANGALSATGNILLSGNGGITAGTVTSGGTTALSAVNGGIVVTDLHSPGMVSASGRSVNIVSPDALTFSAAQATAGDLSLRTLSLSATGALSATGTVDLIGTNGISLGSLTSGGTTGLGASAGDIVVTDLRSVGLVTALAKSIVINSGAGLMFDTANATAGDLTLRTALGLSASGALSASGNIALSGNRGITAGTVTSGGTTVLNAANGGIAVTDLHSPGSVSASGRSVSIVSPDALTFTAVQATAGDLSLTALNVSSGGPLSATGNVAIDGANGIALGSLTSGGTTGITSNGAVSIADLVSAGLVTAGGGSLDITSSGGLTFDSATASAGGISISTAGDLVLPTASASGSVLLASSGGSISSSGLIKSGLTFAADGATGLDFASLDTGGTTSLSSSGGAVRVSDLVSAGHINAAGRSVDIASSGGLHFNEATASGGNLSLTAALGLTLDGPAAASGNVALLGGDFLSSLGILTSGGTTELRSQRGDVSISNLRSAGAVTADGRSISIVSPQALTFDTASASNNLSIQALSITAANGLSAATGNVSLDGANGLTLGTVESGGTTSLHADNGAIVISDLRSQDLVSAFARSLDIASSDARGISFEDAVASAGDVSLRAVNDLTAGHVSATGNVRLVTDENLHTVGNVTGGDILLQGGANVTVDRAVTARGNLTANADFTFALGAKAVGTSISVTSRDIALANGSQLGERGTTQDIRLSNRLVTTQTTFGGAPGAGGYDLDSAEVRRLFADKSITLSARGNVAVGSLQLAFGATGNIGTGGVLKVATPANVQVNGNVDLATSSADDTFSIDPARIDVVAGQGSISMHSGGGTPQGTIDLSADYVTVLTPATRDAISGLTDLAQISKLLATPADPGPAGAFLSAGTIRIFADNSLLIQNAGTTDAFADRRGFRANALDISTGAATQLAINGVILQGGDPVTGLDTIPLVTINGEPAAAGGQFNALSTINGCVIGADCTAPPPPTHPSEPPVTNPTDDDLTSPVDHPTRDGVLSDQLISLGDNAPLIAPPLVDEPITGVGNDDLWRSGCNDSDDKSCPQKKEGSE